MINKCDVYLRGAYGPGNLGDDILLLEMLNILKKKFEPHRIVIGVEDPDAAKEFDSSVTWVHYKKPYISKYFVYGGGGQFFSFLPTGVTQSKSTELNLVQKIHFFLTNQEDLFSLVTRLLFSLFNAHENLVISKFSAAYCIGVGPFEVEGKGTARLKKALKKMDYLSVRDKISAKYCLEHGFCRDIHSFVDPSFGIEGLAADKEADVSDGEYDCSYIVRDWPFSAFGQHAIENMVRHAQEQLDNGKKIRLVSVYPEKDSKIINKYPEFDWLVYDYRVHSVNSFLSSLVFESKYIVSARAHGVWLSLLLNKPVLAIGIEPKLENVHKSMGRSTLLVQGVEFDEFQRKYDEYVRSFKGLESGIVEDLRENRLQSILAKNTFYEWIDACEREG